MFWAVLLIVATGFLAPAVVSLLRHRSGWVLALIPAGVFSYLATYISPISAGETFYREITWLSSMPVDVHLTFYLDGLSLLFGLLVTGIGTFIVIYAGGYLEGDPDMGKFYTNIFLFMASMLGLVTASNLIALFVFWEGTSFTSYLLIGYYHERKSSRRNALQALLVTSVGGLAMFAGFLLLGFAGNTFELVQLIEQPDLLQGHSYYVPALLLILCGAFTKSAQFPFHFWLPNAMAAPTPVSAYLHSATMVKAGVYLLARLQPALGGTGVWLGIVTTAGAVTMVIGAWLALCYTDLKQILAYSTIMILGMLVMLIGTGTTYGLFACSIMILVHALYKGALFMVAGSIDHETGSRDVMEVGGLASMMPVSAGAAALAGLSMAGLPPLLGFIGKEKTKEAVLQFLPGTGWGETLLVVVVLASIAGVAAGFITGFRPFYGEKRAPNESPHEAPVSMVLGPAVLGGLSLVAGLFPGLLDTSLISPAAASMIGGEFSYELSTWNLLFHISPAWIASLISVGLGLLVYAFWDGIRSSKPIAWFRSWVGEAPDRSYDLAVDGLMGTAYYQTRFLQNGKIRTYMRTLIGIGFLLTGYTLFRFVGLDLFAVDFSGVLYYEWVLALLIFVAVAVAVTAQDAILAIISLGVSGFSISLLYLLFSGPDLGITQFLVETLTVILVALVLIHVPEYPDRKETWSEKLGDGAIALGSGTVVTLLMIAALKMDFSTDIPEAYGQLAYLEAHGKNIVNVILVDFRALDTLGEITVLAAACIGVFAVLWYRDEEEGEEGGEGQESAVTEEERP